MFKKLLSNLPFNPSLIGQVSFYARRMHNEESIRRTGLILVVIAFLIQIFSVLSPPQPTLAASGNDIIPGGFTTQARAVDWCVNDRGIRTIYASVGISCDSIQNAVVKTQNTRDYNSQLFSLGRYPYGKAGESAFPIEGANFYQRYLWSWGDYNFKALVGSRNDGTLFMIMFDCGNPVSIGPLTPPPPPTPTPTPPPTPTPTPTPPAKCVWNPSILASDANCFEPCPVSGKQGIPKSSTQCFEPCKVTGKSNIPASSSQCFEQCPIKGKESLPKSSSQCFEPCPIAGKGNIPANSSECFQPCPVSGKSNIPATSSQCFEPCKVSGKSSIPATSSQCFEPCTFNPSIAAGSPNCKPCDKATTDSDTTACLILSKKATNTTTHISNADGTTAKAGDIIDYTLETTNTGKLAVKNFVVQEDIGDLSQYADVVDLHGGKLDDQTKIVSWPAATIQPNSTLRQFITVKIKDPIPQTPVSSSNPGTGDMTMTNVYGNAINIKLPKNIVKTTEQITTTTLPNTGPGESLIISFTLTTIVAYFFARSRLIAKELDIVRLDYSSTGGA